MTENAPAAAVIELHIEELVLHGFAPGDRHAIAEALQGELTQLIAANGLAGVNRDVSIGRVEGGAFMAAAGAPARLLGAQVAQQVFQQVAPVAQGPKGGRD